MYQLKQSVAKSNNEFKHIEICTYIYEGSIDIVCILLTSFHWKNHSVKVIWKTKTSTPCFFFCGSIVSLYFHRCNKKRRKKNPCLKAKKSDITSAWSWKSMELFTSIRAFRTWIHVLMPDDCKNWAFSITICCLDSLLRKLYFSHAKLKDSHLINSTAEMFH